MKKRVLFYCQSVLGIGHFIRSRELALALRDFEVCFVYGGDVVPGHELPSGIEMIQLPALISDEAFRGLHAPDGESDPEQVKSRRTERLLAVFDRFRPDALIIELFPFGRKQFSFELLPLLERARTSRPRAKVVCSLRDILVRKRDQDRYEERVSEWMNRYFDLLLIHADPRWQRLEETFASLGKIDCRIEYTGYVARRIEISAAGDSEAATSPPPLILASLGGGRVGHELIDAVLAAEPRLVSPHRLHIVSGPHAPESVYRRFERQAGLLPEVTLERHTPAFPALLHGAALSISMAGYNTCMDLLSARVPALVYPFMGAGNDEQERRARGLERRGLVRVLDAGRLDPASLAAEIERGLASPRIAPRPSPRMNGAERSAQLLADLFDDRAGRTPPQ
ncbi:MAG: glycosyltransferase family protein [Blastocatellia bacterium]